MLAVYLQKSFGYVNSLGHNVSCASAQDSWVCKQFALLLHGSDEMSDGACDKQIFANKRLW